MKFLIIVVVLVVLCGVFQMFHCEILNCSFEDLKGYYCKVTSLVNTNNTMVITGFSGVHKANKNESDVKAIRIENTNTKYIPANLGLLFNLTVFSMWSTQLIEIKSQDFEGMQDLKELSIYENSLKSVPIDAFSRLTKLKLLSLAENQIEEIPNRVFANNLQLEKIWIHGNRIKFLGSNLFDGLTTLYLVNGWGNACIDRQYLGIEDIIELKDVIKMQCLNPDEIITTTTQNPTTMSSTISDDIESY